MKKLASLGVVVLLLSALSLGQKITKPTLLPKPATQDQEQTIRQGISLHDAKRLDEAVEKYEKVLAENPDCTLAIYELAMTLYTKGDKVKAMETAYRGAKYDSEELPLFYGMMANAIDDVGKPDEAINLYRDAIKMLKDDSKFDHHLSSLYYNVGITYVRQKKYVEARAELKKAVEYNHRYPSPHYLLAVVYNGTKYKIPAVLSAARLISLETNSQRTRQSAAIVVNSIKAPKKDEKTGNINIFMDLDAPKDEGDFGMYDLMLGTLMIADEKKDKGKSEQQLFAEAIDTFIALLTEDKKLRSTFVGKAYVPFLAEMKKQGHSTAFAYLVLYQTGDQIASAWLNANPSKLQGFVDWSKAYTPAK